MHACMHACMDDTSFSIVAVTHSLIAAAAVGLEAECILGLVDEKWSPSVCFCCLSLIWFEKGARLLLD